MKHMKIFEDVESVKICQDWIGTGVFKVNRFCDICWESDESSQSCFQHYHASSPQGMVCGGATRSIF